MSPLRGRVPPMTQSVDANAKGPKQATRCFVQRVEEEWRRHDRHASGVCPAHAKGYSVANNVQSNSGEEGPTDLRGSQQSRQADCQ
jgi:hypothetical protein